MYHQLIRRFRPLRLSLDASSSHVSDRGCWRDKDIVAQTITDFENFETYSICTLLRQSCFRAAESFDTIHGRAGADRSLIISKLDDFFRLWLPVEGYCHGSNTRLYSARQLPLTNVCNETVDEPTQPTSVSAFNAIYRAMPHLHPHFVNRFNTTHTLYGCR
jgi:hypothetical protein